MNKVKIITIKQTCSACPSQWEGHTENNKAVYVRYRWGKLEITLGNNIDEAIDSDKPIVSLIRDEKKMDGHLSYNELVGCTSDAIDWPKEQEELS